MLDSQKKIIKKSLEEKLEAPAFINKLFKDALGGWEVNIDDKSFRRFVVSRKENRGDLIHVIKIQDFWIGNPPKDALDPMPSIQVALHKVENFKDYTLHNWLDVHPNLSDADRYVEGLIKYVADDLINLEMESHKQKFLESL